ncbi:hypothetical protein sos41_29100 [Alphaproteobacteria bacterium SO-S41]|nr:hypothetical protein sos41_29100 [Alphaproteobacteria bacterium SO-S41]
MYLVIVLLLMLVLPVGSTVAEYFSGGSAPLMALVGKWFVFWGVGVRLLLAGIRQFVQPRFTAEQIFQTTSPDVLPLVRELGVANFAAGVVGVASLAAQSFVLPSAISAAIFYGVAGVRHIAEHDKSRNENIAMISDLFIFAVLSAFAAYALLA